MKAKYKYHALRILPIVIIFALLGGRFLVNSRAATMVTSIRSGYWSDPNMWSTRHVPTAGSIVTIAPGHLVAFNQTVSPTLGAVNVKGALAFQIPRSSTLVTSGNIVVSGTLWMHPANANVKQTIRFVNVNENAYVGGTQHDVLSTDVGLWVNGAGKLDIAGTPKTSWTNLSGAATKGSTAIGLKENPTGWQPGDDIAIAPTQAPTVGDSSWNGFDQAQYATQYGPAVKLNAPLQFDHPKVNNLWTAEVMNLTRNVSIEGTPTGRAHIWIDSTKPQSIKDMQIRYMGPRQGTGTDSHGITSRYALHFHEGGEGMRGTVVDGTVVRDSGNHAYVAHFSNGITFKDTIAYNDIEDAYWWDQSPNTRTKGPETNDTVYDHAIAANIIGQPNIKTYRLAGFNLAQGVNNTIKNSVAVGVQGGKDSSGFEWPESSGIHGDGVWNFNEGNITHNNAEHGVFVWQNTGNPHVITNLVSYYNSNGGVNHGAYANKYTYKNAIVYGNSGYGFALRATSSGPTEDRDIQLQNVTFDGANISEDGIQTLEHTLGGDYPYRIINPVFQNNTVAGIHIKNLEIPNREKKNTLEVVYPRFVNGRQFLIDSNVKPDSIIKVQPGKASAFSLVNESQPGKKIPQWQASQNNLAPFATESLPAVPPPSIITPVSLGPTTSNVAGVNTADSNNPESPNPGFVSGNQVSSDGSVSPQKEEELSHVKQPNQFEENAIVKGVKEVTNPRGPWIYILIGAAIGSWFIASRKYKDAIKGAKHAAHTVAHPHAAKAKKS